MVLKVYLSNQKSYHQRSMATQLQMTASIVLGIHVLRSNFISEQLIKALQSSLVEVEASSGVSPDDPALLALKGAVLRHIANLELAKAGVISFPESSVTDSQSVAMEVSCETA
jgi:hypothetical protein